MIVKKKDEDMSPDTRKRITGFVDWVIRGLVTAACVFIWQMHKDQNDLITKINSSQAQIDELEDRVAKLENQMVGWDVLKRMELTLGLLAANGKGNQAMSAIADVIRTERESRGGK